MNKQTKLILSLIGVSALIVPTVLLVVFTKSSPAEPEAQSGSRNIDTTSILETVKKASPSPSQLSTPSPATSSAKPSPLSSPTLEGSPAAQ